MEPMSGDQGLETDRVTIPSSEGQSTLVNSDNAWTVTLQEEPLANREGNPQVIATFVTSSEVRALEFQGGSDEVQDITFILSYWDDDSQEFRDYLDSSGEPRVSEFRMWRRLWKGTGKLSTFLASDGLYRLVSTAHRHMKTCKLNVMFKMSVFCVSGHDSHPEQAGTCDRGPA